MRVSPNHLLTANIPFRGGLSPNNTRRDGEDMESPAFKALGPNQKRGTLPVPHLNKVPDVTNDIKFSLDLSKVLMEIKSQNLTYRLAGHLAFASLSGQLGKITQDTTILSMTLGCKMDLFSVPPQYDRHHNPPWCERMSVEVAKLLQTNAIEMTPDSPGQYVSHLLFRANTRRTARFVSFRPV